MAFKVSTFFEGSIVPFSLTAYICGTASSMRGFVSTIDIRRQFDSFIDASCWRKLYLEVK